MNTGVWTMQSAMWTLQDAGVGRIEIRFTRGLEHEYLLTTPDVEYVRAYETLDAARAAGVRSRDSMLASGGTPSDVWMKRMAEKDARIAELEDKLAEATGAMAEARSRCRDAYEKLDDILE